MPTHSEEVQNAIQVINKNLKFVIQKWKGGMWVSVGDPIVGKDPAYEKMAKLKERAEALSKKEQHWRVIPRNEADMYKAGFRDGVSVTTKQSETKKTNRPLRFLPDNL